MGVQVGGDDGRAAGAGGVESEALGAPVQVPCSRGGEGGIGHRAVELVTRHPGAGRPEDGVDQGCRLAVADGEAPAHGGTCRQRPDHRVPVERLGQVEHPGALGEGRQAVGEGRADLLHEREVRRERARVDLGEAAAEPEAPGALGQRLVPDRVELDDPCARRLEQLDGLRVAEGEGPPAGHGDDRRLTGR